jgi:hypothetical protein
MCAPHGRPASGTVPLPWCNAIDCRAAFATFILSGLLACGDVGGPAGLGVDQSVASVTVTPASVALDVGASTSLSATARNSGGSVVSAAITWTSSQIAVASVGTNGVAQALEQLFTVAFGVTTFTEQTIVPGRTYRYRVYACCQVVCSEPSAPSADVTVPDGPVGTLGVLATIKQRPEAARTIHPAHRWLVSSFRYVSRTPQPWSPL